MKSAPSNPGPPTIVHGSDERNQVLQFLKWCSTFFFFFFLSFVIFSCSLSSSSFSFSSASSSLSSSDGSRLSFHVPVLPISHNHSVIPSGSTYIVGYLKKKEAFFMTPHSFEATNWYLFGSYTEKSGVIYYWQIADSFPSGCCKM